ncbi:hypothetical protein [Massilia eurypsychrophila]|uniref:hypothetical protein n=1 Tax=Massilia eurypsychrophila TaxID=1485217 RepID=UPI001034A64E|nr:hypothetical protein [Massilia eurypsychrophila]
MPSEVAKQAFADGLRHQWVNGINGVQVPAFRSIEDWLVRGAYVWKTATAAKISLTVPLGRGALTDAIASEVSRLSCASYESLLDASPPAARNRALGWQLIRHYYAAFFAAHALLRVGGISLNFFSGDIAATLNKLGGQYLGVSPGITRGLYCFRRGISDPTDVTLERLSAGGGTHEDMWSILNAFLKDVEVSIISNLGQNPATLAAVDVSTKLRAQLCNQGRNNGAWPSLMRNSINYKHDFGVWYPYGSAKALKATTSILPRWHPADVRGFDFSSNPDELVSLGEVCNVLSHMLTATLKDISNRSPTARSCFVDQGPFKLLKSNQIGLT